MTAKEINNMSFQEIEKITHTLTPKENELWAFWGYDGRTYELIMHDRKSIMSKAEQFRKELALEH
jgi:hypothetical protein